MPIETNTLVEIIQSSLPGIAARNIRRLHPIRSRMDIEDVCQITAMRAFASRDQLQTSDPEQVKHWIYKIGTNVCRQSLTDHIGTAKRSVSKTETLTVDIEAITFESVDEDLSLVRDALKRIPPSQATAVEMRYFDFAEYEVIGLHLSCSVQAARTLVSRGLAAVREILNQAE